MFYTTSIPLRIYSSGSMIGLSNPLTYWFQWSILSDAKSKRLIFVYQNFENVPNDLFFDAMPAKLHECVQ